MKGFFFLFPENTGVTLCWLLERKVYGTFSDPKATSICYTLQESHLSNELQSYKHLSSKKSKAQKCFTSLKRCCTDSMFEVLLKKKTLKIQEVTFPN